MCETHQKNEWRPAIVRSSRIDFNYKSILGELELLMIPVSSVSTLLIEIDKYKYLN